MKQLIFLLSDKLSNLVQILFFSVPHLVITFFDDIFSVARGRTITRITRDRRFTRNSVNCLASFRSFDMKIPRSRSWLVVYSVWFIF